MSDSVRTKGLQYAEFLRTLSPEQIAHGNDVNRRNAEDEFRRFNEHFDTGSCYLVPDRIVRNAIQINGLRVKFGVEEL